MQTSPGKLAKFKHGIFTAAIMLGAAQAEAITINFNAAVGMDVNAVNGFLEAGAAWESILLDNIDVNIDIDFSTLGTGILGGAASTLEVASYSSVRASLIADITSTADLVGVSALPATSSLTFRTTDTAGNPFIDNNNSNNNNFVTVNKANAKAMGLIANDLSSDGNILFSDAISWDFDYTDGIAAGAFDFVGVAIHEIGHVLGFASGVDDFDATSGSGPFAPMDLDDYSVLRPLDLWRYSEIAGAILDLAPGSDSYFSLDNGATSLAAFSTGLHNGDDYQASHWKDNLGLGIMDPTFSAGEFGVISGLDQLAMDVIGYDFVTTSVPSPSTFFILLLGIVPIFTKSLSSGSKFRV